MAMKVIPQELKKELSAITEDVLTQYHNYFPARWSVTIAVYFLRGMYMVSNPVTGR
jgi:hypothetical protein